MIFRKCKLIKLGQLRLPEDCDYTQKVKVLGCFVDCQLTLQRKVSFVYRNHFYLRKCGSLVFRLSPSTKLVLLQAATLVAI